MSKYPKWKVGVSICCYYMVEVDGENEEVAIQRAFHEVETKPHHYVTGSSSEVTGVFINDAKARGFSQYVEEIYPEPKDWEVE